MVTYIQRQEAIRIHRAYLDNYLADDLDDNDDTGLEDVVSYELSGDIETAVEIEPIARVVTEQVYYPSPERQMAKAPTVTNMVIQDLVDRYSAANFISSVTDFLTRRVRVARHDILLSERNEVNIWHKLFLFHSAPSFAPFDPVRRDVVRAGLPTRRDPGFSDVALILEKPSRHRKPDLLFPFYFYLQPTKRSLRRLRKRCL
jgi:hypothetical protein